MSNQLTVLKSVHTKLETMLDAKAQALPKDFNKTRFLQNCMTVIQDVYGIENIDPQSVSRALLKGAFLGLDFFNKECYVIPYNKKEGANWVKEIQFQTDYKGERKLVRKYSQRPTKDIYAKLVREGDFFEEIIEGGEPTVTFKPKPFNNSDVIGVFAVCLFKDGTMLYETMSVEECEQVKERYSKKDKNGNFSGAWNDSAGEMYKKTVLRRLCKAIDLDFDTSEQQEAFEESSDFEFDEKTEPKKPKMNSPLTKAEKEEAEEVNADSLTEEEKEEILKQEKEEAEEENKLPFEG